MINTTTFSIPDQRITFTERLTQLLYLFVFFLAFTTLYAIAETRSLESRTAHYVPAAPIPPEMFAQIARNN
ncbi:MAG TPA: hypothetical protein VFE58_03620 [Tepidisphaeraceae bacterium]|jgi:hypothetical protein|nr:hypothetical protein [Tepidisphaeraceae bacterium]